LPETPVTVTIDGPAAALVDAVSVRTLVPAVPVGLKDAVTPAGRPLAARFTAPVNPLRSITVTVLVPLLP